MSNTPVPPRIPGDAALKTLEVQTLKVEDNLVVDGDVTVTGDLDVTGDMTANSVTTVTFVHAGTNITAGTTVTAGTGVIATTGNIVATAGGVTAGTTVTAGTGITSTTGNIVATTGTVQGTTVTDGTLSFSSGVVTGATIIAASDNVAANSLKTTGAVVNVALAAPPSVGQVLTATSATTSTWQTSSPVSGSYADFYALMPGDNAATIAANAAVLFPQTGPVNGTDITRASSSQFNLVTAGDYEVQWQVSVTEPGQLAVALDGTMVASTVVSRATGTSQIVGLCIISATVGQVLTIINATSNTTALTITPGTGADPAFNPISAHVIIKKLL